MSIDNLSLLYAVINLASVSCKKDVSIKTSKKILKVLNIFYDEGLIRGYSYNFKRTKIFIKFSGTEYKPVIKYIKVISTPSKFVSITVKSLSKLNDQGQFFLLSTPKGLLTSTEALNKNVGGNVLCKILI